MEIGREHAFHVMVERGARGFGCTAKVSNEESARRIRSWRN